VPASFIVDKSGYPDFHPGFDKLWLLYIIYEGVIWVYIARYIIFRKGSFQFFGNRSHSLLINTANREVHIAGVAINSVDLPSVLQEGVECL
jgi:hypothetical protein